MASIPDRPLTPGQLRVLEVVDQCHRRGDDATGSYVARKLAITRQRVGEYFHTLSELGWLRSSGSPAIMTRPLPSLTKTQLPSEPEPCDGPFVQRTVQLAPLSFRAEVAVASANDEARTVEVIFTTGAEVERYDWRTDTRYLEALSLDPAHVRLGRLNGGASLLDSHSGYSVSDILGAVVPDTVKLAKKQGRATVRFSKREAVAPIWQDVKDGIVRFVSIGYLVHRYEEIPAKGKNALPVRMAVDWEPFEVSMVPIPADAGAHTRREDVELYPCVIVTRGQEERMDPIEVPPVVPPAVPPAPAPPAPPAPAPDEATRAAATVAERERAFAIRRAVSLVHLPVTMAESLVASGATLDAARAAILDKLAAADAANPTVQHVRVGTEERDKWISGVGAWVMQRAGVANLVRQAQQAKPDFKGLQGIDLDAGEFRGMSLLDLARESLERSGRKTRGLDKMELAGLAMRDITGVQTTSDFVVALENVLNKTLLAAYAVTPDTWRQFCSTGSVVDFRPHPRYRSAFLSRLTVVPEGAEFTNKNIPDATKESITATTKGNIVSLSRQAIINDDMSIFSRVAFQLGRAVALSIEMDVYDLLALNAGLGPLMNDGLTLFHATHLNIGTGAALSVAAIDADRVVLASQKDASSNEILDMRPDVLLLPIGLGGQARVINTSQYDTDIVANKFLVPNKVVGLFRTIVDSPRLTGTRRYLFTDPSAMPTIEVAFLDGVQEPFLEMQQGWRVDGTEWKVRLDYGVAAIEFRGAETNAGV